MAFDWSIPNCITLNSVLVEFSDCNSLDDVKRVARKLMKQYNPSTLSGTEPYSKENCIQIWKTVDEIVKKFELKEITFESFQELKSIGTFDLTQTLSSQIILNYAKYRQSFTLRDWTDFWEDNLSYGQNIIRLLNYFVALPDSSIQIPIIAAFCCQNTALMHLSNTLFLYSRKAGSGKSTIAELISAFQGSLKTEDDDPDGMSQGTDTYVSVRNFINYNRIARQPNGIPIYDPETRKALERNLFLVLDDFPEGRLKDEDFYNILKAYKRQNAYIRKSERKKDDNGDWVDTTVSFHVFCCKVLTACYQVFGIEDYQELSRRCIFIKCQPFEDIKVDSESDKNFTLDNPLFNGDELFKPSEISWRGILDQYYIAWNIDAILRYQEACKALRKPKSITTAQWEISKSLATSGYALGVWDDLSLAVAAIKSYWKWFDEQKLDTKTGIELTLEQSIFDWIECAESEFENVEYLSDGTKNTYFPMISYLIDPKWIDTYLVRAKKKFELDCDPTTKIRNQTMLKLGYKLRKINGKIYYALIE